MGKPVNKKEVEKQIVETSKNETSNEVSNELKNILILRPKTQPYKCFFYRGEHDLQNLIKFLGFAPKIDFAPNGSIVYNFGRKLPSIYKPCIVFVDGNNQIISIRFDIAECVTSYDLIQTLDFNETTDKAAVKVVTEKPKKEKK